MNCKNFISAEHACSTDWDPFSMFSCLCFCGAILCLYHCLSGDKKNVFLCDECGTEKNFISAGARAAVHAYATAFERRPQFLDWKEILVFRWFQMGISNKR